MNTMNLKHALLIPGALTLALLAFAPVLPGVSQTDPAPVQPGKKNRPQLNLTQDQKTRMSQIRESTRTQMQAVLDQVLTAEQKAKLASAPKRRGGMPDFSSLNLTDTQKQQIRTQMQTIRQAARQEMLKILTPEQQQQFQQKQQQRQNKRDQLRQSGQTRTQLRQPQTQLQSLIGQ